VPGGSEPAFVTGYSRRGGSGPEPLDPLDRLALRLSALCGEAVDPLAIAAGLEAEGHNDRLAQERHGLPDLFALAEELYRRVPRGGGGPVQVQVRRAPGQIRARTADRAGSIARPLLRGSLFAVPALCGLALLPPTGRTGTPVRLGIALIQVLAWGYGQGVAHAAYARLNAGDRPAARALLRAATVFALVGQLGLFAALAALTGCAPSLLLPTATALGYCLAAVPALVLGAELRLAAVSAPIGLATLTWTFGLHQEWGSAGAAVIAGAAVLGTLWLAWQLTRTKNPAGRGPGSQAGSRGSRGSAAWADSGHSRLRWLQRLGRLRQLRRLRRLRPRHFSRGLVSGFSILRSRTSRHRGSGWAAGTVPQALYGSCVGIWLLLVLVGPIGTGSTAQLHAAATLTLSMGAAEWHYAWYRQAMRRSLAANHELGGFARRAVAVLVLALTRQAVTTVLLGGAVYVLLDRHSGGVGCYLFALALSPGLLAATVIRGIAARGLLALTALALAVTGLVQPIGGATAAAEVAGVYALALAVAAARFSTRPWTNL
jgi:hypothetical protein